jgi:hypothetical protein
LAKVLLALSDTEIAKLVKAGAYEEIKCDE